MIIEQNNDYYIHNNDYRKERKRKKSEN